MPTYCYHHKPSRKLITRVFPAAAVPESVRAGGKRYVRCREAEWAGQGGMQPGTWPATSQALAVPSSQSREYAGFAAKHGVPTHFDSRGRPVFTDRHHRARYCKLVGAVDYDGGYGDHTG